MKIKFHPQTRGKVVIFHTLPHPIRKETQSERIETNSATGKLISWEMRLAGH